MLFESSAAFRVRLDATAALRFAAEGGWHISLTDATFRELIAAYLRPVTRKLLFGE